MEDWFPLWRRGKDGPWLAHRLDADTAGCLVIALRKSVLIAAQRIFASGHAHKTYWAIVHGVPDQQAGVIDLPLARRDSPQGWRIVPDPTGMVAITDWRVLGSDGRRSWLALTPQTGRTHQLRVHCSAMGHPILGDARYSGGKGLLHLVSRSIRLDLEPTVEAVADPPLALRSAFRACGWTDES